MTVKKMMIMKMMIMTRMIMAMMMMMITTMMMSDIDSAISQYATSYPKAVYLAREKKDCVKVMSRVGECCENGDRSKTGGRTENLSY